MKARKHSGRYRVFRMLDAHSRVVPIWFRCWVAGLAFSYVVAMACWLLTETRATKRVFVGADLQEASGTHAVVWAHQVGWLSTPLGVNWQHDPSTYVSGYGWPIASWGTVWVELPGTRANFRARPLIGVDVSRFWRRDPRGDAFQRVVPVYPLWGQTALLSAMWGAIFYVLALWYLRVTRRPEDACRKCGYPIAEDMNVCPECGSEARASA